MSTQLEAMNIASQCRATASSPLAQNILVDGGNGFLSELLLDAAKALEALAEQPAQDPDIPDLIAGAYGVSRGTAYDMMRESLAEQPVIDKAAAIRIATALGWKPPAED